MKTAAKTFANHYLKGMSEKLERHKVFLLSGGLTFFFLTCVVPLILVVFFILGFVLEQDSIRNEVGMFIERVVPRIESMSHIKDFLFARINEVTENKQFAGYAGFLGLFITASGLFTNIRIVLNEVYQIDAKRSLIANKLKDFMMIVVILFSLLVSVAILPTLQLLKNHQISRFIMDTIGGAKILESCQLISFALPVFSLLFIFLVFFAVYYFGPDGRIPFKVALVSAVWAAGLWQFAKSAFTLYVSNFASWEKLYGAYVFFVILAFWIYYSALIFILGAVIGQLFKEAKGN